MISIYKSKYKTFLGIQFKFIILLITLSFGKKWKKRYNLLLLSRFLSADSVKCQSNQCDGFCIAFVEGNNHV